MKLIASFTTVDELAEVLSKYTACEDVYSAFIEGLNKLKFKMGERVGYTVEIREDYLLLNPKLTATRKNGTTVVVVITPVVIKRNVFLPSNTVYFKFIGGCNELKSKHLVRIGYRIIRKFWNYLRTKQ